MTYPDFPQLVALAHTATEATEHLLEQGREVEAVRADSRTIGVSRPTLYAHLRPVEHATD